MSSVKIHVIGRLGADAEVKQTRDSKKDFATFTLAVDDFVSGKKTTTWFAVADFSDAAKRRAEFLKKGSLIEVQGLETCRIYTDRNNLPQIARDIRATHIDFIPNSNSRSEKEETVDCGTLSKPSNNVEEPKKINIETKAVDVTSSSSESNLVDDLPF